MKEALLWEKAEGNRVRCFLCAHRCLIPEGKRGICGVRENQEGRLYSLVYGRLVCQYVDPVEKKPFFHFLPGTTSYSIATAGCNFSCGFCQNYEISQVQVVKDHNRFLGDEVSAEEIIQSALHYGCKSISFTYTEPTIAFEYFFEVMKLARASGLYNNFVTNGYMTPEMLECSKGYLDAANVDLKAFSDGFYKKTCGARLAPVLEAMRIMKKLGVWLEVTTLVVPGLNDSEEELKECAEFVSGLGKETPWHVSRFYPNYKMENTDPTPSQKLERAREIGLEAGLRYVYTGNMPGDAGENTYCYNCKKEVIRRYGFEVLANNLQQGKCGFCGSAIDGVGLYSFRTGDRK